ncbi:VMAP-C domain-containing protein [Thiocapsa roseopersicina]|uniref:Caspase domain-containing protein n=1 Tax=Thiocapsa roseopersicina TaxID=1058 RepID=A0A1H3B8E7_THIRO|nr:caspase family protein [Thiocapsa roseopersicina]SDX38232.1 hypothetical protein SAMN05421783_12349 [Thiocapsa roseopersicina]
MTDIYGFLVGIERYDQPSWDQVGPCANAIAMAEWLRSINVPAGHIYLFLDPCADSRADYAQALCDLEAAGAQVTRSGNSYTIDTFWRTQLSRDRPADSRLLFYWSGHGFTENDGTRVFVCRDYTASDLKNRVFNGTNFHRHLRSAAFQCFSKQVLLADVCAVYGGMDFEANKVPPKRLGNDSPQRQIAYFATPEGQYARGDDGVGVFTRTTLEVLKALNAWPDDFLALSKRMDAAFEQVGQTPFRVAEYAEDYEISDRLVGLVTEDVGSALFGSVWSSLCAIPVPDSFYRLHFRRTVSSLGRPDLDHAQGLSGMLRELTSLCDTAGTTQAPYGLLEFLLRLSSDARLAEAVEAWLNEHAAAQGNALATARERIRLESEEKILVVDVQNDERGDIAFYEPSLRNQNLLPVPDIQLAASSVTGWESFTSQFPVVIETLRSRYGIADLQIQFTVNPPLFDKPFHNIKMGGEMLGEKFVVLVRYRDRLLQTSSVKRQAWQQCADALRRSKPREITLLPIPESGAAAAGAAPGAQGFCYTRFTVSPPPSGAKEKQILMRLLNSGVAFASWSHQPPPGDDWEEVAACLTHCMCASETLDRFPYQLTRRRMEGNAAASQATLLWDDPDFIPFINPKGTQIR